MSYLAKHRTICAVLEEIREVLDKRIGPDASITSMLDEAKTYAQSMSTALVKHKVTMEQSPGWIVLDNHEPGQTYGFKVIMMVGNPVHYQQPVVTHCSTAKGAMSYVNGYLSGMSAVGYRDTVQVFKTTAFVVALEAE